MKIEFNKYHYLLIGICILLIVFSAITEFVLWNVPESALPSTNSLYKSNAYTIFWGLNLFVGLCSCAVLLSSMLRTCRRVYFISFSLIVFGLMTFVGNIFFNLSLGRTGVIYIILGIAMYLAAKKQKLRDYTNLQN